MAVEQFMPTLGAKHTTEKEVRQKPSIAELTKVETPGKPAPSDLLEDEEPTKKKRRTKKATSEKISMSSPKKDSILIITEKPQAAQKIATALGNERKYTENGVSYYELKRDGENLLIASAVGHLYNLTYSKGQKGWPVFKIEWVPTHENKKTLYTKKYYNLLKKLSKRAKEVIIATDFDVEGEVIGWNILRFICKMQNAKRMKYSTLTKNELEKSYGNLLKELNWGNAYAGETRHILDWLYGINLSRALMSAIKRTDSFRILSIGRVQGPALKIIVEREREIEKFKPEPFWQVFAHIEKQEFKHPKDIFDKKELEKFKKVKKANAETKKTEEKITPPVPFDLTSLQREAYRHHRMSPSETLQIAQKLYLDGIISYPRTSSQKIPDEIEPKKILMALSKHYPSEVKIAKRPKPIEGNKSDPAHPSIYPTGDNKKLSDREEKLYDLIARRFISAFCYDAITANTRVMLKDINDPKLNFTASGMKILEKGWTNVYPAKMEESNIDDYEGVVEINKIDFIEKETQPPKRYSPTSLVTILEKKNLGTKATRSIIVDTLFQRGYLDGKSIKATPLGLKLIEALEKYSPIIIDEELTRQIEKEMEKIESENNPKKLEDEEKRFVTRAEKIITDISKDFKQHEEKIGKMLQKGLINFREEQTESNKLRECPACKKGHLRILYAKAYKRYFIGCSNYPECKQTYTLPPNSLIKKSDKECEYCGWGKLLAIRKGKRPWEFCFNPDCEEVKRQREKWEKRKAAIELNKK